MIDPRENHGAVMELKRLAIQKVWDITEDEAEAFAVSGRSIFDWINNAPEAEEWRRRLYARHMRKWTTKIACWWRSLAGQGDKRP